MTPKDFANDGIVRFFGNRTFSAGVVRRQVPSHDLHHPITRILEVGDSYEEIRMGEVVGVHFQQRSALEDKGRQDHLGQVHADLHL